MSREENIVLTNQLGKQLQANALFKIGEIIVLFIIVIAFVGLIIPLVGDDLIQKQLLVWIANILMLFYVWIGIKLRGEKWSDFGLTMKTLSLREVVAAHSYMKDNGISMKVRILTSESKPRLVGLFSNQHFVKVT